MTPAESCGTSLEPRGKDNRQRDLRVAELLGPLTHQPFQSTSAWLIVPLRLQRLTRYAPIVAELCEILDVCGVYVCMRPITATILGLVLSVPLCSQQANSYKVILTIQKVSPTNVGYDVAIKVANEGTQPTSFTLSGTTRPILHSLGVQQWDEMHGWLSVGPCLDVPPNTTRILSPGDSLVEVVPIGDASHGWSNTVCPNRVEHLGGRIRAVLCVYKSAEQFKKNVPCKEVESAFFQLPEPIHLATLEKRPTNLVQPVYPEKAKKARIEGAVVLSIVIGEDGIVRNVKVVKGSRLLAQSAVAAVRQWHYEPYLLNGNPVSAVGKVTVNFVLPKSSGHNASNVERPADR